MLYINSGGNTNGEWLPNHKVTRAAVAQTAAQEEGMETLQDWQPEGVVFILSAGPGGTLISSLDDFGFY